MFTRQHYIKVAKILATANNMEECYNMFVGMFKADNPNFDETMFKAYIAAVRIKE